MAIKKNKDLEIKCINVHKIIVFSFEFFFCITNVFIFFIEELSVFSFMKSFASGTFNANAF